MASLFLTTNIPARPTAATKGWNRELTRIDANSFNPQPEARTDRLGDIDGLRPEPVGRICNPSRATTE